MSEANFEVENSAVNEYFYDKPQLTDQEVGIFVEEQRNPRTEKEISGVIASLSISFRSSLVQVFLSVLAVENSVQLLQPFNDVNLFDLQFLLFLS